ncbi:ABC transporter permease [Cetobacterium sp.]
MSFRFLRGNLARAAFPMIAVIVGAMSLVMTLSLGDGARNIINRDLSAIGGNRILVGAEHLNHKDLELMERLPFVEYGIFPEERALVGNTVYKGYSKKALIAMKLPILKNEETVLDKEQFSDIKIGEEIELETVSGKRRFLVRGLYQEESPFETMKMGDRVIVSDETFEKIFGKRSYKNLVIAFPEGENGEDYIPIVLKELNKIRPRYNQVRILETPDVYKKVERIKSFVGKSLFILSFISLGIGGVGILNLIATTVRERGSYIGVLRAMGMSRESLTKIFIIEAGIVIVLGTSIGITFSVGMSYIAGNILKIPPYFNFFKIMVTLALIMGISLIFGVYPAKRAGEIEIVKALKI